MPPFHAPPRSWGFARQRSTLKPPNSLDHFSKHQSTCLGEKGTLRPRRQDILKKTSLPPELVNTAAPRFSFPATRSRA